MRRDVDRTDDRSTRDNDARNDAKHTIIDVREDLHPAIVKRRPIARLGACQSVRSFIKLHRMKPRQVHGLGPSEQDVGRL